MSSGFSGGASGFLSNGRRSATAPTNSNGGYASNFNRQQQFCLRSPLAGVVADPDAQICRPDAIGKRSLVDFQQQQNQGLGFYLRNVKPRPNYQHTSPVSTLSSIELSPISSAPPEVSLLSNSVNPRYGHPILQQQRIRNVRNVFDGIPLPNLGQKLGFANLGMNVTGSHPEVPERESEKNLMNHRLQELEKQLLGDEDDGEAVSTVTNSEWSETIRNLIGPTRKPISPSPTSSSSSCSSTSASHPLPCSKQALIDAAAAISDCKPEAAAEILTLILPAANAKGGSEQRLATYMVSALKSRVNPTDHPPVVSELYGEEHAMSTQMLFDVSPCFKLGFMAANLAILEATTADEFRKIHVLDFEIGQGGQYVHLLHALAAKKKLENKPSPALAAVKITAFTEFATPGEEKMLNAVGDGLKALANRIGVAFEFRVTNLNIGDLCREKLELQPDEALAVNFAFKLYKLPDESVTTENLRDELLRRVKSLSPAVVTVVEQDINTNTAPLVTRVRDAYDYYSAVFDSLDANLLRDCPERVRIEHALGRKICNAVACDGRDRMERCEVLGKWRARLGMAGFRSRAMSRPAAESLRTKLESVTRGKLGFTIREESGGICFGWMGRPLTVASAWC